MSHGPGSVPKPTWEENRDYFLIRIRRHLPDLRPAGNRPPIGISPHDVASITPCWVCGGKQQFERSIDIKQSVYRCAGCSLRWLVESGGNPDTLVMRISRF